MSETEIEANNQEPFKDYGARVEGAAARVAQLVPSKPDSERAADLKERGKQAMAPLLALMDEAAAAGFLLRWGGIGPNAYGRHEVQDLHLLKRF